MLNMIRHGVPTDAPPLLIAHGLFGSGRNWGVIAKRLSDEREVIAVDMRNHGDSPRLPTHSYFDLADDLAEVIASLPEGRADVLGHSMGGKAAMVLALRHGARVNKLVVADIAPVAYGHSQQSQIDAMRRVDLARIRNRQEAAAQMQAATPEIAAFLLQSLDMAARRWKIDLDLFEREMGTVVGFPAVAGHFDGPTLFLSGALSDYVLPEHRPQIRALFSQAKFAKIPQAGHWLHAEQPRPFEQAVRVFLNM